MRQVFLDTETTGLNAAQGDRIIEIGCIEFVNRRPSGRHLHHYVNPQRSNHPDAVRVHGITDDFLADKPLFAQVRPSCWRSSKGADVVIHNAAFDIGFLDAELERLGLGSFATRRAHHRQPADGARDVPGQEQLAGRAVQAAGGGQLRARTARRAARRRPAGRGLPAHDPRPAHAGDRCRAGYHRACRPGCGRPAGLVLPVLAASAEEQAAHEALLADIDKACGGKAVWKAAADRGIILGLPETVAEHRPKDSGRLAQR
jgi:DNA polymerase-3 subunit epsilon